MLVSYLGDPIESDWMRSRDRPRVAPPSPNKKNPGRCDHSSADELYRELSRQRLRLRLGLRAPYITHHTAWGLRATFAHRTCTHAA